MKALDLIRWAMQFSEQGTLRLIEDTRNAPLTQPTSRGGNHPLWNMGHLAFIEGSTRRVVTGEPNPVQKWAPLFATGTQPKTDTNAYPPFEEIVRTWRDLRAANLKMLDALGVNDLYSWTTCPTLAAMAASQTRRAAAASSTAWPIDL